MTNIVSDKTLVKELEMTGTIGPRVLVVEASANSKIADIEGCARSVSRGVRRLDCQGYDLKHIEVKAIMLRDDRFEVVPKVRGNVKK